ncbi:MAG TPA: response regulator [Verrucomicrobiae bacterium]|nr:response regulator [Verrucomicrobiae bacterium]
MRTRTRFNLLLLSKSKQLGPKCLLLLWLSGTGVGYAGEPSAAAPAQRSVIGTNASQTVEAGAAAIRAAVKAQASELSQSVESIETGSAHGLKAIVLWKLVIGCGIGLLALVALSNWHRWRVRHSSKGQSARRVPKDPIMAELARAMQPDVQLRAAVTVENKSSGLPYAMVPPAQTGSEPSPVMPRPDPSVFPINEAVTSLAAAFHKMNRASEEVERLNLLGELLTQVKSLKEASGLAQMRSIWLVSTGLLGLLKQFSIQPANMTGSALRTVAVAIDLLETLAKQTVRADQAIDPAIRLLAVDDDAVSRQTIAVALKKIFDEPDMACDGPGALALAHQRSYDVIFLDIEMPGMDGFELCAKIRQTQYNRTTPIVFVTNHHDFESRAKSALVGAHELIAKPFLAFEIALKALTLILRARRESETRGILGQSKEVRERAVGTGPIRTSFCPGIS